MDREDNLPEPPAVTKSLFRPVVPETTSSSSSSSFSSSSPLGFVRQVQAAFKRHRPQGVMQSNSFRPRRIILPQRESPSSSLFQPVVVEEEKKAQDILFNQGHATNNLNTETKTTVVVRETQEDATDTSPMLLGTMTGCTEKSYKPINAHKEGTKLLTSCQGGNLTLQHEVSQLVDIQRKVQFSMDNGSVNQGKNAKSMINTEGEVSSIRINHESRLHNHQKEQINKNLGSDSVTSLMVKSEQTDPDQLHHFKSILSQPMTQSSVAGLSCAITTSSYSTSAPLHNATSYCCHLQKDNIAHGILEAATFDVNRRPLAQGMGILPSNVSPNNSCNFVVNESCTSSLVPDSSIKTQIKAKEDDISKGQEIIVPKQTSVLKDALLPHDKLNERSGGYDSNNARPPQNLNIAVKVDPSKTEMQEKAAASSKGATIASKRNYDPDLFFKVNGKLYQRLGKIGSGGSSEVHKVISSDCAIYALKKIKLKGRDYATAYGFCQEIVYLSKLKGKTNIIQLVDYEVTDKMLLREVMNGSMSHKEARVKNDGYIFMVLEYGEIDLANMLSQKWKEMDGSNQTIDENWLRFYWQQILQAVNTIHEERIVHSDLKPANFLLVKGSLKLIDFGIAKAIMSDTTNIQRESQVGTLSYMSPEAFMCNESDSSGNVIKCGRPSDIWSLGCILYQMVYGKTPFSEYKTFWAKFKVITDPNHGITYGPLTNPRLLDLMKKCLAWDRNERWRIPQLLQHPFLTPPVPPQLALSQNQSSKLLQLIAETCTNDPQASSLLFSQLQQLLTDPARPMTSLLITSTENQSDFFPQISNIYLQLEQQCADP